MSADLEKTISLVNTPRKAAIFLLALELCSYKVSWGMLALAIPKGSGHERKPSQFASRDILYTLEEGQCNIL